LLVRSMRFILQCMDPRTLVPIFTPPQRLKLKSNRYIKQKLQNKTAVRKQYIHCKWKLQHSMTNVQNNTGDNTQKAKKHCTCMCRHPFWSK